MKMSNVFAIAALSLVVVLAVSALTNFSAFLSGSYMFVIAPSSMVLMFVFMIFVAVLVNSVLED